MSQASGLVSNGLILHKQYEPLWSWNISGKRIRQAKESTALGWQLLPIFEAAIPEDDRPRLALIAAEAWIEVHSQDNVDTAFTVACNADSAYADSIMAKGLSASQYFDVSNAARACAVAGYIAAGVRPPPQISEWFGDMPGNE